MMYNNEFQDRVGVLIGCSRDTGTLLAKRYLEEGMKLIICDKNPDVLSIAADLQKDFPKSTVEGIILDVTQEKEMAEAFAQIEGKYHDLFMLHYNAGVIAPLMPVTKLTEDLYDLLYKVNFRGAAFAIKYAAPIMKKQEEGGSIVVTASWYGRKGYEEAAAYCGSKAAVINLTQVAAIELGKYKIRVNNIAPGDVDSVMLRDSMKIRADHDGVPYEDLMQARCDQHPLKKIATFTDVANIALFYSSSQCGHTTGQTIYAAGGAELCF